MLIGQREKEKHLDSAFLYFCRCNLCFISYTFIGACLFHACISWEGSFFQWKNLKGNSLGACRVFMHVVKYSHGILLSRSMCWLKLE